MERALDRITTIQKSFIDSWLECANVKQCLAACGIPHTRMGVVLSWFSDNDFRLAMAERANELLKVVPSGIATQEDALRVLYDLLASDNEEIQLKAAIAVLKSKNPKVNVTNINLKEALDAAMTLEKNAQRFQNVQWADEQPPKR